MKTILLKVITIYFILQLFACSQEQIKETDLNQALFQEISAQKSGIKHQNAIAETVKNNILTNDYIYSGGGVAVGDINNDKLADIFFVSNMGKHHLYLNKGNFEFEDISTNAGFQESIGWASGVTMADVNQDGYLDIYLCKGGEHIGDPELRANQLYINQKNNTFLEEAAKYGINDKGASTQSAFFDYDSDGDLDLYILNIPIGSPSLTNAQMAIVRNSPAKLSREKDSDRLYQNQGNNRFKDVSAQAGILNWGYGLGLAIADINLDNLPDIFITNDFEVDNFYYQNMGNGKFREMARQRFRHASYFAMGVDVADVDNNGHLDIFEVEMLPEKRKKAIMNMQPMDRAKFEELVSIKMTPQYMRNSLHLNQGFARFSEIAQFAGVHKTDWSWGTLLVDLDDDGFKDIFVANGISRDMKDRDFQHLGNDISANSKGKLTVDKVNEIIPSTPVKNYVFKNKNGTQFNQVSDQWGFGKAGFSNGLAYADFDNDGDLDLIVNNLNEPPSLYKNSSRQRGNNFLNISFKGSTNNSNGIGAKVKIQTADGQQFQEMQTVRGYQSSSQHLMHFGLAKNQTIKSLEVNWSDGKTQKLNDIKANQTLVLEHKNATGGYIPPQANPKYLVGASKGMNINFVHQESNFSDFDREILLPHKLSQLGPALASADINGDGQDDFFVGGAADFSGALFTSNAQGKYQKNTAQIWEKDSQYEDIAACFFDADSDGDQDLYVVSGSNEFEPNSGQYQDRIYINDGQGNFTKNTSILPSIQTSGSCVEASDFDGDGDLDLFVGGRLVPGKYPLSPRSFLLQNEGGKFVDITSKIANDLLEIGMVTSAIWSDYDGDKDSDLLVVGEWMGVKVFNNDKGDFTDVSEQVGLQNTAGWWFKIEANDLDQDGDQDYVIGNIGLNHKFKTSAEKPFQVYCDDFDKTGSLDIVLAFHQDDKLYPVRGRDCSSEQMPFLTEKFPTFASFGDAQLTDILGDDKVKNAKVKKQVQRFESIILRNDKGKFTLITLPNETQYSAITGIEFYDLNQDGKEDILLAGNMYHTEPETSRADANLGCVLFNKGNMDFESQPFYETGFYCPGDVKDMEMLKLKNGQPLFVIANNDAKLQTFRLK